MLKPNEPIVVACWTKQNIFDQLNEETVDAKKLKVSQITDKAAKEWADKEADIAYDAISYGEDFYGREIGKLNDQLIKTMSRSK